MNRLVSATETGSGGWSQSYGYDAKGNRWVCGYSGTGMLALTLETPQNMGNCTETAWFTPENRITNWGYDNGNVTAVGSMSRTFTYDGENRQMTAVINGQTSAYTYDGEGRRVKAVTPGGTTMFVYDAAGQLAAEYGPSAVSGTQYLTVDHLGSTRLVTTATVNGETRTPAVYKESDYLPFGEELKSGMGGPARGPSFDGLGHRVKFTGKERDAETGLDYFGARCFSGAQGRFTSPDPTFMTRQRIGDPQQWNLYAYTRNNPLKYVDPDGRELKLAIYNSGLPTNVATRVADTIALKYRQAGLKNVTYDLRSGSPSLWQTFRYEILPTPNSHLFEMRSGRAGEPAIRAGEGGHNWGGQSAVDTSAVTSKTNDESQVVTGVANMGVHEVAHDALGHVDSPTNIMNSTGAADPNWLANPNLMFTPGQARALQRKYNKSGEVDRTPPPPPPPPKKKEEEERR